MARKLTVVVRKDPAGWLVGTVPELPGVHSQAHSLDELMARMREAVLLYFDVHGKPRQTDEFVGIHELEIAAEG
ncbi:MAG: type II toxin-antitoxin system HicB family antitoxin [Thermoplasmatota archaeon]